MRYDKPFYIKMNSIEFRKRDILKFDSTSGKLIVLKTYRYNWWKKIINEIIFFIYSERINFRHNELKVKYICE